MGDPTSLVFALLVGVVVGWVVKHLAARRRLGRLEGRLMKAEAGRAFARRDLEALRGENAALGRELDAKKSRLAELEATPRDGAADGPRRDDLQRVGGIGPKIEDLLNAAGITTWAQLAAAPVAEVRAVLDAAGPRYRVHDPASWSRQAALAAAGRWDELAELQGRLKGGRGG